MPSLPDVPIPLWLSVAGALATVVATVVLIAVRVVELRRSLAGLRREVSELREGQKVLIAQGSQLSLTVAAASTLSVERYRLAERSVSVEGRAELLFEGYPADARTIRQPYVLAHVDLRNTGQRPVDVLACLVSGRVITDAAWPGLGRDGREVGWDTLAHAYWDAEGALLAGLSTTGNMFASRGQLLRLDPDESESLLRLDAVIDVGALLDIGRINLLYKIFVVVLGHPVVIDPQGRRANELKEQLALLPHQHLRRWRCIQYSLSNLNRFPFRLALDAVEDPHARDPLGYIATPTGWRCFLLHHWDFEQLRDKAPTGAPDPYGDERKERERAGRPWPTISDVSHRIRHEYNVYDPRQRTAESLERAKAYCAEALDPMLQAWRDLNRAIDRCRKAGFSFEQLIQEPPYQQRWQALLEEGYVLSHWWGGNLEAVDELAPERYSARIKYALATIEAPGHS